MQRGAHLSGGQRHRPPHSHAGTQHQGSGFGAHLSSGQRRRPPRGHIRLVQVRHHVVAAELQQPRRAEVEAAQRLQRQARERLLLQLPCAACENTNNVLAVA